MAFTSPNFVWASPVSTTGPGFLLAAGLKTKWWIQIKIKQWIQAILMLICQFRTSHYIVWHLSGMWCHRHRSWISCLHFFLMKYYHVQGEINPTFRPQMWSRRSGRSPALASCSPSSSLSPLLCHPIARTNDLRAYPQTGTHFWRDKRWMLTCGDWREGK